MPLSKRQLEQISEIISRRFNTFAFETLGPRALTADELRTLQAAGIVREGTTNVIMDAAVLGRITAVLPLSERKRVTYQTVLDAATKVETTAVERAAIDYATDHAGEYIKGIRDMVVRDVSAITARGSEAALRAVQENVAGAIEARSTISELKTRLFDAIDNRNRDWQRVAHTEINTAVQQGVYRAIREASDEGKNQLVFKRPNPDACVHCKRVYLKADGLTPKVFRLSDLEDSNVGRRAAEWGPVIGSVHPWCNCQLQVVPEGFDFVKTRVVVEAFEDGDGRAWRRGEIVDAASYSSLGSDMIKNIGQDAVLAYTGATAKPEIEKSMPVYISDEDDCTCEHD